MVTSVAPWRCSEIRAGADAVASTWPSSWNWLIELGRLYVNELKSPRCSAGATGRCVQSWLQT